ncbi:hypothetical protein KJI95_09945 [Shewanella sp. JM162201]|uniref:Cytochrome c7-like domain-containing protein n=1 Tax=Shewanella jiangmenensis TaxID=2837387 RepID=A0ABS5V330_9GAMM|nr:cytochrome c3 family protein [Shewanella jiangmenensis]MBT1444843.1 hypothetical protein [Shewanella jiangmenensis]
MKHIINPIGCALLLLACSKGFAIDGCEGCHDDKWQSTPAHVWIDSKEHIDAVACVDCHRWKDGMDLPPELPSQALLERDCGACHPSPENLAQKMGMAQTGTN